jgi:hypothetical protein
MAVGYSAAVINAWLDALARSVAYTEPASLWIQLHTGDPGAAGTANVAGNATRKQVTFGTPASGGAISNTVAIAWLTGEVDTSEDYTFLSLWDQDAPGGNFQGSGPMTANAVVVGDTFTIPPGDLDLAVTPVAA